MGRAVVSIVAGVVMLATAAAAFAGFAAGTSAGETISTATFAPPTGLSAAQVSCKNNKPPQISVSWTASASSFTTGYTIYRSTTSGSGYTQVGTVNASTTTFTDPSTTLAYSTTYYYVVDATVQSWSARSSEAQVTTLNSHCN
jgi:hypothetical protein